MTPSKRPIRQYCKAVKIKQVKTLKAKKKSEQLKMERKTLLYVRHIKKKRLHRYKFDYNRHKPMIGSTNFSTLPIVNT